MKIHKRSDPKWVEDGTCPFYFFKGDPSLPPCFITTAIVKGESSVFSSVDEAQHFIESDCFGRFDVCPYIHSLWDFYGEADVVDLSQPITLFEGNISQVEINFGWPFPVEEDLATDVLILPTNTYARFQDLIPNFAWDFTDETKIPLMESCSQVKRPLEIGDIFQTEAEGTPYGKILHCVISGLGGEPMDDVSEIMKKAFDLSSEIGASSVTISPLCLFLGNESVLTQTLHCQIKGFEKHISKNPSTSLVYVSILMPPTLESHRLAMGISSMFS